MTKLVTVGNMETKNLYKGDSDTKLASGGMLLHVSNA